MTQYSGEAACAYSRPSNPIGDGAGFELGVLKNTVDMLGTYQEHLGMQPLLKFAMARDDERSVVLDAEPSELDAARWRRRMPVVGEVVLFGGLRGRVRTVTPRAVAGDDDGPESRLEVEVLIEPEDE